MRNSILDRKVHELTVSTCQPANWNAWFRYEQAWYRTPLASSNPQDRSLSYRGREPHLGSGAGDMSLGDIR